MPNVDAPHGFRPVEGCMETHSYPVAAANAIIGVGDLVVRTAAGVVDRAAAAAVQIVGVAAEPKAASAGGTMLVYDHPDLLFEGQTDNGSGVLTAAADLNLNADIVVAAATHGISRMEIDESSGATTATLPLTVLRLYPVSDNAHGEFNRLVVKINNHVFGSLGTTGI